MKPNLSLPLRRGGQALGVTPAPQMGPALQPVTKRLPARLDDCADVAGFQGWMIIAVFFGLIGTWSALAPLNGAVIAEAVVKVDGNRRPVQHVDGGIVRNLLVREGEAVKAGQPLVVLDDGELAASVDVLDETVLTLRAGEARLVAEQREDDELTIPPAFAGRENDARAQAVWHDQQVLFRSRRREQDGESSIAKERLGQLEARIAGTKAQLTSLEAQDTSLRRELASLRPLLARGIVTRQRLLELERTIANVTGQIGQATATLAAAEQAVAEQRHVARQARLQRATAVAQELRDVRLRLAEMVPKLATAATARGRTVVRAPADGRVVGLGAFKAGAVVGRGERMMDIVPDGDQLVVEARIPVADIADLSVGAPVEVRLTGHNQKTSPPLAGRLEHISADRFSDQRTGMAYYAANVRIDGNAPSGQHVPPLIAGMGASVTIPTASRTALQYMLDPLLASFRTAMRER
ncbi:MAG: HlyD family type I secretion periplasmic adaptor subunit [Hyphomicrobiaceae bacterium]